MHVHHPEAPTFYVSGVHSGPNPSPGFGVAQSLRAAYPHAHIVGVDYSVESSGLHSPVFDELWVQRSWKELDLDVYQAAIAERLADGRAAWFPGQDLEVQWLADALPAARGALAAPSDALRQIAKPAITAARDLPLTVPEFLLIDREDWDLHTFCRAHGWQVWMKGPNYEAMRVRDWPSFRHARAALGSTWATDALFVQRHVSGNEESVALCAYQGELLDCVHLRKHHQTSEGKTWSGSVSEVEPAFLEPLRAVIAELEWTGGAELEFVRAADDTLHLIDWNSRFPAWIHAASFAGHNLPARLAEAAGFGTAASARCQSRQFTRVVQEIPVRDTHPLPAVRPVMDEWQVGSKHPSGMPLLAKRLSERAGVGGSARHARVRPASAPPGPVRQDLERLMVDGLTTPRRILLAHSARDRFGRIEAALADAPLAGAELTFGYSVKTNPHPTLLGLADEAGMMAEVISAAELRHAMAAGFPAERIILNGPASQYPDGPAPGGELLAAFADSPHAFERWLADGPPRARYLGMRLRPVTLESRFGAGLRDPKRFAEVLGMLRKVPAGQALGLHFHFASDVLGPARWFDVFEGVLHWARAIEQGVGRPVRCLDVGGGWFPDDFDRELLPRLGAMMGDARALLPALERFVVEPGKAMAQPTMALVTTVLEVRRAAGGNGTEAVVDAAISELPMAPYYPHRLYARAKGGAAKGGAAEGGAWQALGGGPDRLLGRICMETDILASDVALPEGLAPGDRLVIGDAGAYDASMAYNFGRGVVEDACD